MPRIDKNDKNKKDKKKKLKKIETTTKKANCATRKYRESKGPSHHFISYLDWIVKTILNLRIQAEFGKQVNWFTSYYLQYTMFSVLKCFWSQYAIFICSSSLTDQLISSGSFTLLVFKESQPFLASLLFQCASNFLKGVLSLFMKLFHLEVKKLGWKIHLLS